MTEKRFELTESDIKNFRIYDYEKEDAYFLDCDKHTGECLVDLLNELWGELVELKNKQIKSIGENEQLKQYKQAVSDVLMDWSVKNLSANEFIIVHSIMKELNVGDVE